MKTKIILIIVFLFSFRIIAQVPNFDWVDAMDGNNDKYGQCIKVDAAGNIYTVGAFQGTVDFDPGAGTNNLSAAGGFDIFIFKLGPSGNLIYAKRIGSSGGDLAFSVSIDFTGNVFVTGSFTGTVDFDPGTGTFNLSSPGQVDIFVLKLDSSGNFAWVKRMGGTGGEEGRSIIVDSLGNIYIAGYFFGTTDFDPGTGTFNLISQSLCPFVCKLDASGNFLWAKNIGTGSGPISAYAIAYSLTTNTFNFSNNIYVIGSFKGTIDFDPGPAVLNLSTATNDNDIFISKLDSSGNLIWVKQMGGVDYDIGFSISTDIYDNVYSTGDFSVTGDFDPGPAGYYLTSVGNTDIFISKLDSSGNFKWAKSMGGIYPDDGNALTTDASGNVFTTGNFNDTVDFNPGVGVFQLTAGFHDIFISELDSAGNFVWAVNMPITGSPSPYSSGHSIFINTSGDIFTTGFFTGTVDFDPGAGMFNITSLTNSGRVIFVHKMSLPVGINENDFSLNGIFISPNPATTTIYIERNAADKPATLQLLDCYGRKVEEIKIAAGEKRTGINVKSFAEGIYFVRMVDEKELVVRKVVLQK